jgi:hypothetical protein
VYSVVVVCALHDCCGHRSYVSTRRGHYTARTPQLKDSIIYMAVMVAGLYHTDLESTLPRSERVGTFILVSHFPLSFASNGSFAASHSAYMILVLVIHEVDINADTIIVRGTPLFSSCVGMKESGTDC